MKLTRAKNLQEFFHYNSIKYKNIEYYIMALTHTSMSANKKTSNTYERVEFLGDSILQFLSSEYIYKKYSNLDQGRMTYLRSNAVRTETLSDLSQSLGLPLLMKAKSGQIASDAKKSPKVQADLFEAISGAIYLDLGIDAVRDFFSHTVFDLIDHIHNKNNKDPKSQLQEYFQTFSRQNITYEVTFVDENTFSAKAIHEKKIYGQGKGKTKKQAETNAAIDALKKLNI
ncbi:ribonuclease III [Mycoplasmopsis ciconiae]|uniref:Ribonuclease 3 n=1 Tax=Mycoplasmopsis ciconiae TaxID=561067 RepID=A0ABU7MM89_9BACT|nr:ribonuclease III [Mycoplasmopsis ciconiae]